MREEIAGKVGQIEVYPLNLYRVDVLARRGNPQVARQMDMTARTDVSTAWSLAEVFLVCATPLAELRRQKALMQLDWDEAVEEFFLTNEDHVAEFGAWLEGVNQKKLEPMPVAAEPEKAGVG